MTRDLYGHEAVPFDMATLPIAAPPVVQAQFSLPFATNQMERPERREELIAQWYALGRPP